VPYEALIGYESDGVGYALMLMVIVEGGDGEDKASALISISTSDHLSLKRKTMRSSRAIEELDA
jgi:hypothetical protein